MSRPRILMIGADAGLAYLVGRYAEQSGYDIAATQTVPSVTEVHHLQPAAILFLSVESLEAAQALVAELTNHDVPLWVCSSVADQARARELGADHCLLHPLTYDGFLAVLTTSLAADGKTNAPEAARGNARGPGSVPSSVEP